jgi:UPF0716 protein FxsA
VPVLALLLIFIAVPLAELYVILRVGDAIGPELTVFLLALDSVVGSLLLRSQGRAVWRRFSEATAAGRVPHQEVLDGVLVIFGGAFLITPGFITDVVGLLLLLPPTRALARGAIVGLAKRNFVVRMVSFGAGAGAANPQRPAFDVDGTAVEHQPPQPAEPETPRLER